MMKKENKGRRPMEMKLLSAECGDLTAIPRTGFRNLNPPYMPCRAINIANCEPDIVRSTLGCFQVRVDVPHIEHSHCVRAEQDRSR